MNVPGGIPTAPAADAGHVLPRGPVLDWSSWAWVRAAAAHSLEALPHTAFTTSGRAAIYQALLQLNIPAGRSVLVPTYHCPTMIAPVFLAHLQPAYFALRADGAPDLHSIAAATAAQSAAIIVPHYFGLSRSLAEVRRWCDERRIALIEDCAHCYFGEAGERPVGAWGDFSIASLSKFFPVSEAGLLASAQRAIAPLRLQAAGVSAQVKGVVDVLETASRHRRLAGLGGVLSLLFAAKNRVLARAAATENGGAGPGHDGAAGDAAAEVMLSCDMARITHKPLWSSMLLKALLPRGRIRRQRQRNYTCYARHFVQVPGARALWPALPAPLAPYVFPLWIDDARIADAVYAGLREQRLPVFRWDRLWPGTPDLAGDVGVRWSRQVLQLLCHQDLADADVERTAVALTGLLRAAR